MAELPWYWSLTIFLVVIIVFVLLMVYHRAILRFFGSCLSKWEDRRKRRAAATATPQPPRRPQRPFDMNPPPEPAFDVAGLKEVNVAADVEAQTVDKKPAGRWCFWRRRTGPSPSDSEEQPVRSQPYRPQPVHSQPFHTQLVRWENQEMSEAQEYPRPPVRDASSAAE